MPGSRPSSARIDQWGAGNASAAVVGPTGAHRDARQPRPSVPLGVGDEAADRDRHVDRGRARVARARRARRSTRFHRSPPARAHLRAGLRRRRDPRQAGHAPDLFEPGLRPPGGDGRGASRRAVRDCPARLGAGAARDDGHRPGRSPVAGARGPVVGPGRLRARAAAPDPARARRRWPRRPPSPSPGCRVWCPASAGSIRAIGGSASSCTTRRRRTGWARPTARLRSVTSVGPARSCGSTRPPTWRCVVLTDREFGPWALEAWPAFSDALLQAAGPGVRPG